MQAESFSKGPKSKYLGLTSVEGCYPMAQVLNLSCSYTKSDNSIRRLREYP